MSMAASERLLVLMAVGLAALEKSARSLARVGVIWATVVLLGGYVDDLESFHFWLISGLLVVEGSRVFLLHHTVFPRGAPIILVVPVLFHFGFIAPLMGVVVTLGFYIFLVRRRISGATSYRPLAVLQALFIAAGQLVFAPVNLLIILWKGRAAALSSFFTLLRKALELGVKYVVVTIRSASQVIAFLLSFAQVFPYDHGIHDRKQKKHLKDALYVFFYVMVMGQILSILVDAILIPVATMIRDRVGTKKFIAKDPVAAFFNTVYQVSLGGALEQGLKMNLVEFLLDSLLQLKTYSRAQLSGLEILQVLNARCESDARVQMSRSDSLIHHCLLAHKYRSLKGFKQMEFQSVALLVKLSSTNNESEEEAVFNVVMKTLGCTADSLDYVKYLADQYHGNIELTMLQMKLLLLLSTYPLQHKLGSSLEHKAEVAGSILLKIITEAPDPSNRIRDLVFKVFVTDPYSRTEQFASQQDDLSFRALCDKVALWQDGDKEKLLTKLGIPAVQCQDIHDVV